VLPCREEIRDGYGDDDGDQGGAHQGEARAADQQPYDPGAILFPLFILVGHGFSSSSKRNGEIRIFAFPPDTGLPAAAGLSLSARLRISAGLLAPSGLPV
jgi:hypothetical protein